MAVQKRDSKAAGKNEEFLDKGKKALAQGEHELAISYFRQLLKWEPDSEEYRKLLSQAELEKAKSQVNFITRPIYMIWASFLIYILRMHKAALNTARILAKSSPWSKGSANLYAACCFKLGMIGEAIQTFEVFLREKPFDEGILQKLSKIYYDRLDYPNAVRTLDALRKLRPDDQEISKMYDVAITQKYTSEGTDVKKLQRIEEERKKVEARQPKLDEKKVNLLIEQCKQKPDDINLRIRLGKMLTGGLQWEQAAGVYEAALEMAPGNPRILEALAEVYDELGRPEDADSMLNLLSDARPDDQELKKKILDRQIARVTASEPGPSEGGAPEEAKAPDLELERLKQERLEIEIADYRQRIKDNPANPDLHLHLGKLLRSKGDLDEAIRSFQTASRNPTRAFQSLKLLGETFYEKGMLEIAVEQLDRAIERSASSHRDFLSHDMKEIHYTLSRIYEDLDDLDKAIEFLQPIYEEDLNFKDVQTRFEQLYQKRTSKRKQKAENDNLDE